MKASIIFISFVLICFVTLIIIQLLFKKDIVEKKNKIMKNNNHMLFINNNIKKLNNTNNNMFIPKTTCRLIRKELDDLNKIVLLNVNKPNLYEFHKTDYDNILVKYDGNNKHFIYDMFVYDKIKNYDLKLRIDLIKYNSKEINNKLIPSAMEIISVPNKFLLKPVEEKINNTITEEIHINSIDIVNSSLFTDKLDIINTSNTEEIKIHINKDSNFKGLNNTSNHYTNVDEIKYNPYIEESIVRNKWPELNHSKSLLINIKKDWNEWGIPNKNDEIKYIQKIAEDNPTYNKQIGPNGQYDNLFKKNNASGTISSSSMQPTP